MTQFPDRFSDAETALLEVASAQTGLTDFGEPSYLEGLRRLLESLDSDLPRGPQERELCFGSITPALVSRLYAEEGWKRNPAALSTKLVRPVFIVGSPRTGTTALHKLLSCGPSWQGLQSWLVKTPMPRPARVDWPACPEYQAGVRAFEAKMRAVPELKFIHYVEPDDVDECLGITSQTMASNGFGSMYAPSYDAWWRAQDARHAYRRLADNLRLIGANEPEKRWLLKNPSHIQALEELLDVFEDAVVIHIHRDPLKSMPSFWNLMSKLRKPRDGAGYRPRTIVDRELVAWGDALDRSIPLARRFPDRILEVYEDELIADPLKLAVRIYTFAEEPLTTEAELAMRNWISDNPQGKYGAHRYAAEDFVSSLAEIAERMTAYRAHHRFAAQHVEATAQ